MPANGGPERVLSGRAGCLDGREDAPSRRVQLLVARTDRAELELLDAVPGKTRMRVAVDEPRQSAQTGAVELLDLAVERTQVSHPADGRDLTPLAEEVRVIDDLDLAERVSSQRHVAPGGAHDLREVADEQPLRLAGRAHSAPRGGIGGSSPCWAAASAASS